jgi:hypothetical protein
MRLEFCFEGYCASDSYQIEVHQSDCRLFRKFKSRSRNELQGLKINLWTWYVTQFEVCGNNVSLFKCTVYTVNIPESLKIHVRDNKDILMFVRTTFQCFLCLVLAKMYYMDPISLTKRTSLLYLITVKLPYYF